MCVSPKVFLPFISWFIAVLLGCLGTSLGAQGIEANWEGNVDTLWSNAGNWKDDIPPGVNDVALIPDVDNQPVVDGPATVCSGIVLEQGATVTVTGVGNALYVIGEGDLDGDGWSDQYERDRSSDLGNFDIDNDDIPNFADDDSDADLIPDACEIENINHLSGAFNPYVGRYPVSPDYDGDDVPNAVECAEGTDPFDRDSFPVPMPMFGVLGLVAMGLVLLVLSVWVLRKSGPRTRRILSVLLVSGTVLSLGGFLGIQPAKAVSPYVDFALGESIEGEASSGTLFIKGDSIRPWNGKSTYVSDPLTLEASGGAVYLGGMRTTVLIGMAGQGSLEADSAYDDNDHPFPVSEEILGGYRATEVFLGERLDLDATAAPEWIFRYWADDASGSSAMLQDQVTGHGQRLTAVFGPAGLDLVVRLFSVAPLTIKAGPNGEDTEFEFQVMNIGGPPLPAVNRKDAFYLSRDARFDGFDLFLGEDSTTTALASGGTYTASITFDMPDVAPGQYFLLGRADAGGNVVEQNEFNNVTPAPLTVLDVNLAN
jgi:hypothetical protein